MISKVLNRPTLVLNRNWQPVAVATVARALVKVWSETARVVDPADYQLYDWSDWTALQPQDGEAVIRSSRLRIRAPEVIVLTHFDRTPDSSVSFCRRNIYKRDRYTCQYCGRQPGGEELTIDHVLPRSRGGQSNWENCVLACLDCNAKKADRTPDEASMAIRTAPIKPRWRPLYASPWAPIASWSKFVSEAYWSAELKK